MKFTKFAAAIAAVTLCATVSTAMAHTFSVDYRHRFEDQTKYHFDRICLTAALDNGVGFYVDSSFKSGSSNYGHDNDPDQWGDFTTNATEMSLWYNYAIEGTGWVLQPGLVTESTQDTTGYKPYFRVQYNFDNGIWVALRPRFDYWRYDTKDKEGNGVADQRNGRIDAFLGYKYQNWDFSYQFTYMKALNDNADGSDRIMYDNETYNWEHEFTVGYKMGQWRPYIQIANLKGKNGTTTDDRQTRWAAGVSYTF